MVSAYLDASVLVSLLLEEPDSQAVSEWITAFDGAFAVSDLAAAEVASAISLRVRRGEDSQEAAELRLDDFDRWRAAMTETVPINAVDIQTAGRIVRMFDLGLRAPDAIHAAVCRRMDMRMATLDRQLARACDALDTPVVAPGRPII